MFLDICWSQFMYSIIYLWGFFPFFSVRKSYQSVRGEESIGVTHHHLSRTWDTSLQPASANNQPQSLYLGRRILDEIWLLDTKETNLVNYISTTKESFVKQG